MRVTILTIIAFAAITLSSVAGAGETSESTLPDTRNLKLTMTHTLSGRSSKVLFRITIPQDIKDRQQINSLTYSIKPTRLFKENGTAYAEWIFEPFKQTAIVITADVTVYRRDLTKIQEETPKTHIKNTDVGLALKSEKYLEFDNEVIQAEAAKIPYGNDTVATARAVMNHVKTKLKYRGFVATGIGAAGVLKRGTGDCTDFSDLFVALCRAKGIPARTVDGFITMTSDTAAHTWAEFYDAKLGWVPVDPLHEAVSNKTTFEKLENKYLYLSFLRNHEALFGYHIKAWRNWRGTIKVKSTLQIEDLDGVTPKRIFSF